MSRPPALELHVEGPPSASGFQVVVFVRSLEGGEDREFTVPSGKDVELHVPRGRYLVEAVLPSGERLRKVTQVPPQERVRLGSSPLLPHGLGFHQALLQPRRWERSAELDYARYDIKHAATPPRVYLLDKWPSHWEGTGLNEQVASRSAFRVDPAAHLGPSHHEQSMYGFVIPSLPLRTQSLRALVVAMGDKTFAVPFAPEWQSLHREPVATKLLVNTERQRVSTTITDETFAPLLAYLSSGKADLAAKVLGRLPLALLLKKFQNPYAAAAGAYVLISGARSDDSDPHWRPWLENLANGFPWLADGAILEGHALLRENRTGRALERFLQAFDRGVPLFAEGVRLLLEGLLSFSDEDVGVKDARRLATATEAVRQWACWLDPRESFTTLSLAIPIEEEGSAPLTRHP